MRTLILAALLAALAGPAWADQPITTDELKIAAESIRPAIIDAMGPYIKAPVAVEQSVCIGIKACYYLITGKGNTAVGACSGISLTSGSDNVLVGDHTATPTPHTSGFVNIGNTLCFWRATGERVACPPLGPECQ